jgi:NADPH:quinone reductase-like Zn-dependent oxidoreductase
MSSQILQAQGKYQNQPPFPFVLGTELAGKIADNSPIPEGEQWVGQIRKNGKH